MGEWTTGNGEVSGSIMKAIEINKSSLTLPATPSIFSANRLHMFLALHCRCSTGPSAESQLLESTEHHLRIPMIPINQRSRTVVAFATQMLPAFVLEFHVWSRRVYLNFSCWTRAIIARKPRVMEHVRLSRERASNYSIYPRSWPRACECKEERPSIVRSSGGFGP